MVHQGHDVFVTSDAGVALTKMVNMFDFNRYIYLTINNIHFEPVAKVKEIHTSYMYNKVQMWYIYFMCKYTKLMRSSDGVFCDVYNTCHLFVDLMTETITC